jgi:hypothetical protein
MLQDTPFLDISSKVNAAGECGPFGVAFDPDFDPTFATTDNNYYVYYTTVDTTVHNRVSCFLASLDDGNVVAGVGEVIFDLPPLSATNYNGELYTLAPTLSSTWRLARMPGRRRRSP